MNVGTGFGRVWTLEYLVRERIVQQLCEAARLAAADFQGSRPLIREILEDLRCEVEEYGVARPATGLSDLGTSHVRRTT